MNDLLELARHIIAMKDDAHFNEHPEWESIVKQAENVVLNTEETDGK